MSDTASKKSSTLIIVLLLVAVAVAGGLFFMNKGPGEAEIKNALAQLPGNITVEKVDTGFFGSDIVLHGVKAQMAAGDTFLPVTLDKVTLKGVNKDALKNPGTQKLADYIRVENLTVRGDGATLAFNAYTEVFFEDVEMQGLWLDVQAVQKAMQEGYSSEAFATALLSLRVGPNTWKSTRGTVGDMSLYYPEQMMLFPEGTVVRSASQVNEGFTLTEGGKMTVKEYAIDLPDGSRFVTGEAGLEGFSFPADLIRFMVSQGLSSDPEAMTEQQAAQMLAVFRNKIELKNLYFKDLALKIGAKPELTAKGAAMDMRFGAGAMLLSLTTDTLTIPVPVVLDLFPPERRTEVATMIGKDNFILSTHHKLRTEDAPDGRVNVIYEQGGEEETLIKSEETLLFSSKRSTGPEADFLPVDFMSLQFDKYSLSATDLGLLDLIFALAAEEANVGLEQDDPDYVTGMSLKQDAIEQLQAVEVPEAAPLYNVREDIVRFLMHRGTLNITAEPPAGIGVMQLVIDPSPLFTMPVSSSYTPPVN